MYSFFDNKKSAIVKLDYFLNKSQEMNKIHNVLIRP